MVSSSKLSDKRAGLIYQPEAIDEAFRVKAVLAEGSFGIIYAAEHNTTKQMYSLKEVSLKEDKKGATEITEEIALLASLDHPNIVSFRAVMVDFSSKRLFIVQDFCMGGDLYTFLDHVHQISKPLFLKWMPQMLSSLAYLHAKHICFRDIKPENYCIDHRGNIQLVDFGLARKLRYISKGGYEVEEKMTTMVGSDIYMAPEMLRRQPYDKNVDLWALGLVAYQMVEGNHPYSDASMSGFFVDTSGGEDLLDALTRSEGRNSFYSSSSQHDQARKKIIMKILHGLRPTFAETHDVAIMTFINLLIEPDPEVRVGSPATMSIEDLYHIPLFEDVDWDAVHRGTAYSTSEYQQKDQVEETKEETKEDGQETPLSYEERTLAFFDASKTPASFAYLPALRSCKQALFQFLEEEDHEGSFSFLASLKATFQGDDDDDDDDEVEGGYLLIHGELETRRDRKVLALQEKDVNDLSFGNFASSCRSIIEILNPILVSQTMKLLSYFPEGMTDFVFVDENDIDELIDPEEDDDDDSRDAHGEEKKETNDAPSSHDEGKPFLLGTRSCLDLFNPSAQNVLATMSEEERKKWSKYHLDSIASLSVEVQTALSVSATKHARPLPETAEESETAASLNSRLWRGKEKSLFLSPSSIQRLKERRDALGIHVESSEAPSFMEIVTDWFQDMLPEEESKTERKKTKTDPGTKKKKKKGRKRQERERLKKMQKEEEQALWDLRREITAINDFSLVLEEMRSQNTSKKGKGSKKGSSFFRR